jgi:hypothetical protein
LCRRRWHRAPGRGDKKRGEDPAGDNEQRGADAVCRRDPQALAGEVVQTGGCDQDEDGEAYRGADPGAVEAIPEAMPCSRSATPVAAAINMVVNTTPSPILSATIEAYSWASL